MRRPLVLPLLAAGLAAAAIVVVPAPRCWATPDFQGHPLLLFPAAELPALRARVRAGGRAAAAHALLRRAGERALASPDDSLLAEQQGSVAAAELGLLAQLDPEEIGFAARARDLVLEIARRWDVDGDDFATSLRLRALALGYDLAFEDAGVLERKRVRQEIQAWLREIPGRFEYARYAHNPYTSNRAMTVGANVGLAALAVHGDVAPEARAEVESSLAFAHALVRKTLDDMLDAAGSYREGVLYAAWALRMGIPYFEARRRFDGVDVGADPRLARVAEWLCYELLPEGEGRTNNLNDSLWKTRPLAVHSTVLEWAQFRFASPLAEYLERHVVGESGWPDAPSTDRVAAVLWDRALPLADPGRVLPPARLFRDRGLYIYRSGWKRGRRGEEILFTFFSGRFAGGHAQEDQSSFTLYANGDRWALDAGYASPGPGPKESESHNLVLVDGRGQHNAGNSIGTDARIAGALLSGFADWLRGDARQAYATYSPFNAPGVPFPESDWSWGYDGGNPLEKADRDVLVLKGLGAGVPTWFLIADDIRKDAREHDYDWLFHTSAENTADLTRNPVRLRGRDSDLEIFFAAPEALDLSIRPYEHGGEDPPTQRLVARAHAVAPRFCAALVPLRRGAAPPRYEVERHGASVLLTLDWGTLRDEVLFNPDGAAVEGALRTDAQLAAVRWEDAGVRSWLVAKGTRLAAGGLALVDMELPGSAAMAGDTLVVEGGASSAGVRAWGPRVRHVAGPGGPQPFVRVGGDVLLRQPLEARAAPAGELVLGPCRPNPFGATAVRIEYALPRPGAVRLSVYDLRGRRVRTLVSRAEPVGWGAVPWDGRDDRGRPLPSGIYFVRLRCDAGIRTAKLLLAR